MRTYRELFDEHRGRLVAKIDHFFDDYEPHFARLRRPGVRILEVGVAGGGSLELWRKYFGDTAEVHGVDLDPDAVAQCPDGAVAHLGSQIDPDLMLGLAQNHGPFDLILDDGSHRVDHQIATFEMMYPTMSEDGLYVCEDAFTSYWPVYGGGLRRAGTFIEFAKAKIDELHAFWLDDAELPPSEFTRTTRSITFISGAVLFELTPRRAPTYELHADAYVPR